MILHGLHVTVYMLGILPVKFRPFRKSDRRFLVGDSRESPMAEDNQPGEGELLTVPAAILEEPEERPSTVGGSPTRRTRDHLGRTLPTTSRVKFKTGLRTRSSRHLVRPPVPRGGGSRA